jgi:hypothetical protein
VIRARRVGDTEIGAEEGGSEFGDLSFDDQTPKGKTASSVFVR